MPNATPLFSSFLRLRACLPCRAVWSRRAGLAAGAATLALLLGGCFDGGGSDDDPVVAGDTNAEVPIVTAPSTPVTDPVDACDCTAPADPPDTQTDKQRSCAP